MAAVSFSRITKAFINMSILTKDPHLSLEQLVQHEVLCLKPDYIAEFLQRVSELSIEISTGIHVLSKVFTGANFLILILTCTFM